MNSQIFLDLWVFKAPSNQSFGSIQCVLRVGNSLAFSRHAHQTLTICYESNDWRSCPRSLCVLQHLNINKKTFRLEESLFHQIHQSTPVFKVGGRREKKKTKNQKPQLMSVNIFQFFSQNGRKTTEKKTTTLDSVYTKLPISLPGMHWCDV